MDFLRGILRDERCKGFLKILMILKRGGHDGEGQQVAEGDSERTERAGGPAEKNNKEGAAQQPELPGTGSRGAAQQQSCQAQHTQGIQRLGQGARGLSAAIKVLPHIVLLCPIEAHYCFCYALTLLLL